MSYKVAWEDVNGIRGEGSFDSFKYGGTPNDPEGHAYLKTLDESQGGFIFSLYDGEGTPTIVRAAIIRFSEESAR